MTELRKCKHKGCKQHFVPASDDLVFCPSCRELLLFLEQGHGRGRSVRNVEALATSEIWNLSRPPFDYRIIDENGVETWASDLAKRYDRELRQRAGKGLQARSLKKLWPSR